ncbi:MAG TPA: DUF2191 domain-containing protein [Propionibacteriaceae bacterium]|jgi:hypothetical protein|nr:DUF2191 domain-containing protein [Propionibacteriaceae bacterium]
MRTTLDIDDNMLAVARVRAREKGISIGAAVSEIMRRGLEVPRTRSKRGFPVFQMPPDAPVITDEIVARYRDDDPFDE